MGIIKKVISKVKTAAGKIGPAVQGNNYGYGTNVGGTTVYQTGSSGTSTGSSSASSKPSGGSGGSAGPTYVSSSGGGGGSSGGGGGSSTPVSTAQIKQQSNLLNSKSILLQKKVSNLTSSRATQTQLRRYAQQKQIQLKNLKSIVNRSPSISNEKKASIGMMIARSRNIIKSTQSRTGVSNIRKLDESLKKIDEELTKGLSKERTKRARKNIATGGKTIPLVISNIKSAGYSFSRPLIRAGEGATGLILASPKIVKAIPKAPAYVKKILKDKSFRKQKVLNMSVALKSFKRNNVNIVKTSPTDFIASVGAEIFLLKGFGKGLKITGKVTKAEEVSKAGRGLRELKPKIKSAGSFEDIKFYRKVSPKEQIKVRKRFNEFEKLMKGELKPTKSRLKKFQLTKSEFSKLKKVPRNEVLKLTKNKLKKIKLTRKRLKKFYKEDFGKTLKENIRKLEKEQRLKLTRRKLKKFNRPKTKIKKAKKLKFVEKFEGVRFYSKPKTKIQKLLKKFANSKERFNRLERRMIGEGKQSKAGKFLNKFNKELKKEIKAMTPEERIKVYKQLKVIKKIKSLSPSKRIEFANRLKSLKQFKKIRTKQIKKAGRSIKKGTTGITAKEYTPKARSIKPPETPYSNARQVLLKSPEEFRTKLLSKLKELTPEQRAKVNKYLKFVNKRIKNSRFKINNEIIKSSKGVRLSETQKLALKRFKSKITKIDKKIKEAPKSIKRIEVAESAVKKKVKRLRSQKAKTKTSRRLLREFEEEQKQLTRKKTRFRQELESLEKQKNKLKVRGLGIIGAMYALSQEFKQKSGQKPRQKFGQSPRNREEPKSRPGISQKPRSLPAQPIAESTAQKTPSRLKPIYRTTSVARRRKIKKFGTRNVKKRTSLTSKKQAPLFFVYGKSGKKYIKISKKPLEKIDALSRGAYAIDNTTAKTFKIVPAGRAKKAGSIRKIEKNYFNRAGYKLREYRVKKGRKFQIKPKYIERRKYGIDTKGEKKGLTISKFLKQNSAMKRLFRKGRSLPKKRRISSSRRKIMLKNLAKARRVLANKRGKRR